MKLLSRMLPDPCNSLWFPHPSHVLCRHHHGSPTERQPGPPQPGRHPTAGGPGILPGLRGAGSGDMAEAPADHRRQRRCRAPRPVAARPAGTRAPGEVRPLGGDRAGSPSPVGTSTPPRPPTPSLCQGPGRQRGQAENESPSEALSRTVTVRGASSPGLLREGWALTGEPRQSRVRHLFVSLNSCFTETMERLWAAVQSRNPGDRRGGRAASLGNLLSLADAETRGRGVRAPRH